MQDRRVCTFDFGATTHASSEYFQSIERGRKIAAQHSEVSSHPKFEVAAPIANVGYIMPFPFIPVTINEYLNEDPFQLYRVRYTWVAHGGLSRYPDSNGYIYYL